jgi:hypothetical protein
VVSEPVALKVTLIAAVIMLVVSVGFYLGDLVVGGSSRSSNDSSTTTSFTPLPTTTTAGSINFSSPSESQVLMPGQVLTISGNIVPRPTTSDVIYIAVYQVDSITVVPGIELTVRPDGTFSYSILVGASWYSGGYVVKVSDTFGAFGTRMILVLQPTP